MKTLRNLCRGAIAGFTGSAVMYLFRLWWELVTQRRPSVAIFGFDREADVRSARLLLAARPGNLSDEDAARIALAFHYLYGMLLGCLFVNIRDWNEWMYRTSALPLATVLWLCADEIPVTLSGLSHPLRKSIASHASALIAHWLFVLVIRSMLPQGMVDKPLHHINEKR
jgi:hypothetical protein